MMPGKKRLTPPLNQVWTAEKKTYSIGVFCSKRGGTFKRQ